LRRDNYKNGGVGGKIMEEAIQQVLSNEAYTTDEERVDAIKKELAKLVIPKDKYNDLSNRLKNTESEYATLQAEYDDFKKSKMTDDEKRESEKKAFDEQVRQNAIAKSDLAVQKLLLQNGIEIKDDDNELKDTLATIVSEDYEKSIKLANSFISLINKTKDQSAKETTTKLLNETPKPIGGLDSSSTLSKVDMLKKDLEQAVKDKDPVRQAELITQIYQEEQKTNLK
jgi:hypothetical protein